MDTTQRTRYEIPALIVVDAVDQEDAWTRAKNLSATLDAHEGPGAFFFEIGVAPTNKPRTADDLEGRDTVEQHVESIRSAIGDEWVWDDGPEGQYTEDEQRLRRIMGAAAAVCTAWDEGEDTADLIDNLRGVLREVQSEKEG